MMPGE
jgi:WD40 repeat protein